MTLSCGCIPDASGYGYCDACTKALRQKIWNNMSEKHRNYDRNFAPNESASNYPNKCCDMMPAESLHADPKLIHFFCEVKEVPEQPVKVCRVCLIRFTLDAEFVDGQQKGEEPCCIRCYGRNHCQNHYAYMDAIVRQTVKLIERKYSLKIEI